MRSRQRINADYKQAAGLLLHDLVWSADLDSIRLDLALLIEQHACAGKYPDSLTEIVRNLIATENDITI